MKVWRCSQFLLKGKEYEKKKDNTILIGQGSLVVIGKNSESHLFGLHPSSVFTTIYVKVTKFLWPSVSLSVKLEEALLLGSL